MFLHLKCHFSPLSSPVPLCHPSHTIEIELSRPYDARWLFKYASLYLIFPSFVSCGCHLTWNLKPEGEGAEMLEMELGMISMVGGRGVDVILMTRWGSGVCLRVLERTFTGEWRRVDLGERRRRWTRAWCGFKRVFCTYLVSQRTLGR